MGDESLELPQASVMRIIKASVPEGVIISKDAKLAFCRAARVFIQYLTACSNDYSKGLGRATINANHVLGALEELEFKDFSERLSKVMEERVLAKKTAKKDKKPGDEEDEDEEQQKEDDLEAELMSP